VTFGSLQVAEADIVSSLSLLASGAELRNAGTWGRGWNSLPSTDTILLFENIYIYIL
jgi:hypothetical protein